MDKELKVFRDNFFKLLDSREWVEAKELVDLEYNSLNEKGEIDLFMLFELAGCYIDLGDESNKTEDVDFGLNILIENYEYFNGLVTDCSYFYCVGNGYHAKYRLETKGQKFSPKPINLNQNLLKAKDSYLRALRLFGENDFNMLQPLLTNLSNNLKHLGRIVEPLQWSDIVLEINPEFHQAIISKADSLVFMYLNSNCAPTKFLFSEMYLLFTKGNNMGPVPEAVQLTIDAGIRNSQLELEALNVDINSLEQEKGVSYEEYKAHPQELKYYLDNFLGLSEHGLYCKCNGASVDDLRIGYPGLMLTKKDEKIAHVEQLLNHLKSEFSFARRMYYEFIHSSSKDNVYYETFGFDGILYGLQYEKLRASFRYCFGILDKIAEGLMFLFNLPRKRANEPIYFESFWGSPTIGNYAERWIAINDIENLHLTALYSIACDLNKKDGEFGFYKIWRNKLEHGVVTLQKTGEKVGNLVAGDLYDEVIDENIFKENALHLLQLVRASIFSFTFCVRKDMLS